MKLQIEAVEKLHVALREHTPAAIHAAEVACHAAGADGIDLDDFQARSIAYAKTVGAARCALRAIILAAKREL